jgi:hypothetical protein
VLLTDADIDGDIRGLRINGVEVAPLVEGELDRLHPERTKLRPTTPAGMRAGWAVVESFWADTMQRAGALPETELHRSVNGEWSFTQTLRHLVFVTDAWLGHAVRHPGRARPGPAADPGAGLAATGGPHCDLLPTHAVRRRMGQSPVRGT